MLAMFVTGLACAVSLVLFAAVCSCLVAIVRVVFVVRAVMGEGVARAEARDRYRAALRRWW